MAGKAKAPLPVLHTTAAAKQDRKVVDQINAALAQSIARVAEIDNTADAASLWAAADDIGKNLAVLKYDVGKRLVEIAPVETYNYTPKGGEREERSRPTKEQVVEGVGVVTIEKSSDRKWSNVRELAHVLIDVKMQTNEGVYLDAHETVNLIFDLFSVGDPRVTALREAGFGAFDAEPWVESTSTFTSRVKR